MDVQPQPFRVGLGPPVERGAVGSVASMVLERREGMRCDIVEHGAGPREACNCGECPSVLCLQASRQPANACACACAQVPSASGPGVSPAAIRALPSLSLSLSLLLSLSHDISGKRKACEGMRRQVGHCLSSCLVTARNLEQSTVALLSSLPPIPVCKVPQCWDPT